MNVQCSRKEIELLLESRVDDNVVSSHVLGELAEHVCQRLNGNINVAMYLLDSAIHRRLQQTSAVSRTRGTLISVADLSIHESSSRLKVEPPTSDLPSDSVARGADAKIIEKNKAWLSRRERNKGDGQAAVFWRCSMCRCDFDDANVGRHCCSKQHEAMVDRVYKTDKTVPASSHLTTINLRADLPANQGSYSGLLLTRPASIITMKQQPINESELGRTFCRLQEWEPFWRNVSMRVGLTSKVTNSTFIPPGKKDRPPPVVVSGAQTHFTFGEDELGTIPVATGSWGRKRNNGYSDGDVAFLLRMLPLENDSRKRADRHLWPKGTFVQVNGPFVKRVTQRTQQKHDESLWKGRSYPLDLAEYISSPYGNQQIEIATYDDQQYVYALTMSVYRSPSTVFQSLMNPKSDEAISVLEKDAAIAKASLFASQNHSLSLEGDDEQFREGEGRLSVTLIDPVSKTLIRTPVRGKCCRHFQCCDLENFIHLHSVPSSNWQCPVCSSFVSFQDLEVCGFTIHLLREFQTVASADRDRVDICSDGSYRLVEGKANNDGLKREPDESHRNQNSGGSDKEVVVIDLL